MATEQNITTFYKDESIPFELSVTDAAGDPVASPASLTVKLVIAKTDRGAAIGDTAYTFTLSDVSTSLFTLTLTALDMAALSEGRAYYYNIWAVDGSSEWVLATGQIVLQKSISLPA